MTGTTRYGYTVTSDVNGEHPVVTMATRHDAVGLAAALNRGTDTSYAVEVKTITHENELPTLKADKFARLQETDA